jgi:hypothetical protein
MPLYTVMTQDGFLSAEQRDVIAAELVRIHTAAMSVPAHFVHSIFATYPRSAERECEKYPHHRPSSRTTRLQRPDGLASRLSCCPKSQLARNGSSGLHAT